MSRTEHLRIFAGYGIELEYMIVDRATLAALPCSDYVLAAATKLPGAVFDAPAAGAEAPSEVELGDMAWSNELVMHVLEIKTNGPASQLGDLHAKFQREVDTVNRILAPRGAMLMPTAMHPFFDPAREMKLWIHDNAEIYAAYDRIFGCKGHGWSNLQSIHINFPFYDDAEFGRLHAAIRLALPILPGLAASSPIYESKVSGLMDSRLEFYRFNQQAVPSLTGGVIPEQAFTKAEYDRQIFQQLYRDIKPLDPEGLLQDEWLNSRGAIARFQRHAIEIRVLDIQESPRADAAVISTVVALVRGLAEALFIPAAAQMAWEAGALRPIFEACLKDGSDAVITDAAYLKIFAFPRATATAGELWTHLADRLSGRPNYPIAERRGDVERLVRQGCLAKRILAATGPQPTHERVVTTYAKLCETLARGLLFDGVP